MTKDIVTSTVEALSGANRLMRAVESILIDLFAATAPWLAPVLPAYMVWHSLTQRLDMPDWVSIVGALVIEFLGLSAISTTLALWTYNDHKRESAREPGKAAKRKKGALKRIKGLAPVWVAFGAGAFYLIVVLVVNVLLDQAGPIERTAKALLSSLSVIAGIILAVRAQHAKRLEEIEQRKAATRNRRATVAQPVADQVAPEVAEAQPTRQLVAEALRSNPALRDTELGEMFGVSRQAIAKHRKALSAQEVEEMPEIVGSNGRNHK